IGTTAAMKLTGPGSWLLKDGGNGRYLHGPIWLVPHNRSGRGSHGRARRPAGRSRRRIGGPRVDRPGMGSPRWVDGSVAHSARRLGVADGGSVRVVCRACGHPPIRRLLSREDAVRPSVVRPGDDFGVDAATMARWAHVLPDLQHADGVAGDP